MKKKMVLARERQPSQTFLALRAEFSEVAPDRLIFNPPLSPKPNFPRQCQRTVSAEPGAPGSQQLPPPTPPPPHPHHTGSQREETVGQQATNPRASVGRGSGHSLADRHVSTDKRLKKLNS